MATTYNETPPAPTEAAPDWTYEELIETFVKDYSAGWLEWCSRNYRRGRIVEGSYQIIVELRHPPCNFVPANLNLEKLSELQGHRFWFLDKNGLEELNETQGQEIMAHPTLKGSWAFSSMRFCFEEGYLYKVVRYLDHSKLVNFSNSKRVRTIRERIARGSNGKLCIEESVTLGITSEIVMQYGLPVV